MPKESWNGGLGLHLRWSDGSSRKAEGGGKDAPFSSVNFTRFVLGAKVWGLCVKGT